MLFLTRERFEILHKKVQKDEIWHEFEIWNFTWIRRRSTSWSSSLAGLPSSAPAHNLFFNTNQLKQVHLLVQADDKGANEDTDGEADDADGDNEDGEAVHGEALGGEEHVGAGGERYVPLAEKNVMSSLWSSSASSYFPIYSPSPIF